MTYTLGIKASRKGLIPLVLVLGFALSLLIAAALDHVEKKGGAERFQNAVENRYAALQREIDMNLYALSSLQAFYSSSVHEITRAQFKDFANHILCRHSSIQALEWIPLVPDLHRERYESAARTEGFPGFRITEQIAQGKMGPAAQRKEYFPVYFVEPYRGNELALGFDLASNSVRLEAMEASRKTGEVLATAGLTLVQETKNQYGVIVFAPVYQPGVALSSERLRADNLKGFALGVFRVGDMVEKSLTYLKPEVVDFVIEDPAVPQKDRFLYTHISPSRTVPLLDKRIPETSLIKTRTIDVAGRKWLVTYAATPGFMAELRSWHPWWAFLAGLAFTGLAAGFLLAGVRHAERLEGVVAQLGESEERYRSFVQNFQGIAFKGAMDYSLIFIHGAVQEITGYTAEEFLAGLKWDRLIHPDDLQGLSEGTGNIGTVPGCTIDREYRIVRKDGEFRWIREMIQNSCDPAGVPLGVNGAIYDITAAKLAEKRLAEQQSFLASVMSSIQDGISILDRDFRVVMTNPTLERVFRHNMPLAGRFCYEAFHHRSTPCEPCPSKYTLETGKPGTKIFSMQEEGEQVWMELYTFPFFDLTNSRVEGVVEYVRNITARKRMEDELAESHMFTDQVINGAGEGIVVYDRDLRYRVWNPYMERLTGYSAENVVGRHPRQLFPFMEERGVLDCLQQTLAGKESGAIDFQYAIPETGGAGWASHTNTRLRNAKGEVIGVIATVRNITEYKRTELALVEEKAFTENALNTIPDTFFVFDLQGKFLRWNRSLSEVTGYSNEEISTMQPADFFPGEEVPKVQTAIDRVVREGHASLETNILTKEGRELPYELRGAILLDHEGSTLGISGTGRDITERRKAEEDLRTSREFVRNILETVDEGFIVIDPGYRIISANKAYQRMVGRNEGEVIGEHCYTLSHRLSRPCCETGEDCPVRETLRTGEARTAMHTHFDRANRKIFVEIKSFPVKDKSGQAIAAIEVINNITEKRELERQLQHAQKMEAIGTLAGGIAHDFNNILAAILGYANLAVEEIEEPSKAREDLQKVITAGNRAADLVRQILTISRQGEQQIQPVRMQHILKEALQFLRPTISSYIRIQTDIDPACREIKADPTEIHQVIMNLCTNAYHAMREVEKGNHVLDIGLREIDLAPDAAQKLGPNIPAGRYVRLSVTDTGYGISENIRARIFDPYFTTKTMGRGTGLGLAMVHSIIKDCGGAISVESEVGKGSTFTVYIPVFETGPRARTNMKNGQHLEIQGGDERILIIDDEELIVRLLKRTLEKQGYLITAVTECEEAIRLFTRKPMSFDLIITDMNMPRVMGLDLAQACLEIRPDIPIILCTGFSEKTDKARAKAIGIRKLLSKPVESEVLVKEVRRILDEGKTGLPQKGGKDVPE